MSVRNIAPVTEAGPSLKKITFSSAKITEITGNDTASKTVKFACWLGRGFEKLFTAMEWQVPELHTTNQGLDGKFKGGHFVLSAKDKLIDADVELDFDVMTGFVCKRLELEGKKGKGFRRELRFSATLKESDSLGKLEAYQNATDNARGTLVVNYIPEPVQTTIPETTEQLTLDETRRAATAADND